MPKKSTFTARTVKDIVQKLKRPQSTAVFLKAFLAQKENITRLQGENDYAAALYISNQLRKFFNNRGFKDRYNSVRKTVLAACLSPNRNYYDRTRKLLGVTRRLLDKSVDLARTWSSDFGSSLQPTVLRRSKYDKQLPELVKEWIIRNTTPSSNAKNVVNYKEQDGKWAKQVTHWRTSTLEAMFQQCKLEVPLALDDESINFSKSFFYSNIPPYVRLKKQQDGLCPMHHTGRSFEQELIKKRGMWHNKCNCKCAFCSASGCNHGKQPENGICSRYTCTRCSNIKCLKEWNPTFTQWDIPVQRKREGGGLYWENVAESGSRTKFSTTIQDEMKEFVEHDNHNIWHKQQMANLLDNLPVGEVVVKCDYIQNIDHSRGKETSSAYFGKRQSQFLSMVVWYNKVNADGTVTKYKTHFDYISSYLKHNSLFFQKSLIHLLTHLRVDIGVDIKKLWLDTDGGKAHFKSRISFFFASTLPELLGGIPVHWVFAPSYHGKGECDSHGAVVKRAIKLFVLDDNCHVDDEDEAIAFINTHVWNSKAFPMNIRFGETEQDCSGLKGSSLIHEMRFFGEEGVVYSRKWPCLCASCKHGQFATCTNTALVGSFKKSILKKKSTRLAKARYIADEPEDAQQGDWLVTGVHGKRFTRGKVQYLIGWEGWPDMTWQDVDKLNCFELVEQYEMNEEELLEGEEDKQDSDNSDGSD